MAKDSFESISIRKIITLNFLLHIIEGKKISIFDIHFIIEFKPISRNHKNNLRLTFQGTNKTTKQESKRRTYHLLSHLYCLIIKTKKKTTTRNLHLKKKRVRQRQRQRRPNLPKQQLTTQNAFPKHEQGRKTERQRESNLSEIGDLGITGT